MSRVKFFEYFFKREEEYLYLSCFLGFISRSETIRDQIRSNQVQPELKGANISGIRSRSRLGIGLCLIPSALCFPGCLALYCVSSWCCAGFVSSSIFKSNGENVNKKKGKSWAPIPQEQVEEDKNWNALARNRTQVYTMARYYFYH